MARKKISAGSVEERKKDDLNKRVLQIRKTFFDDNNRIYSDRIEVNEQALSQICSGKRNAGIDIVQRIVDNMPNIDANWLLTGAGSMEKKNDEQPSAIPYLENRINELQELLSIANQTIGMLKYQLTMERKKTPSTSEETDTAATLV